MKRRGRYAGIGVVMLLAVSVVLAWPVARWLEARAGWAAEDARVDAVYILAGRSHGARGRGVVAWLQAGGETGRILLPRDTMKGPWSRPDQRNLTMGDWALRGLNAALKEAELDVPVEVVSVDLGGTDAEVASVARLMAQRSDLQTLALASSRFHLRRTRQRAAKYFRAAPAMIPGAATWQDHAPWVTGFEVLKLLRDRMGLTKILRRRDSRATTQKPEGECREVECKAGIE